MLYFAYGSDLNWQAMLDWGKANNQFIPPRADPRPAVLPNHRLCFPAYDPFWRGGIADVAPEPGKSVSGALFEVNEAAAKLLVRIANRRTDKRGREAGESQRSKVKVNLYHGGKSVDAYVYRLQNPQHAHVPPTQRYVDRLADAAWRLGLSAMWIMHLRSFSTQTTEAPVAHPVLRSGTLRLTEMGVDPQWLKLRTPHAIIQANRIRLAGDGATCPPGAQRLRAV